MKKFIVLLVMLMLSACKNEMIIENPTKSGVLYEEGICLFYYPQQFNRQEDSAIFINGNATIELTSELLSASNDEQQLSQLYALDLERTGHTILSNAKISLSNGDGCYEIVSKYNDNKYKFLIIYEAGSEFVLSYCNESEAYDKEISNIDQYLYTFRVKENGE